MKKFIKEVIQNLEEKLVDETLVVTYNKVPGNNGIERHSISIKKPTRNTAPCIYMDNMFEAYRNNRITIDDAVEKILDTYEKAGMVNLDLSFLTDYKEISPRLYGRLVNTEKNEKLLETLVHREIEDLSLIYIIEIERNKDGVSSIKVTNEFLEQWGVDEETLYAQLMVNMKKDSRAILLPIENVLKQFIERVEDKYEIPDNVDTQIYVATNTDQINGAAELVNVDFLDSVYDKVGGDYYIIPSSINECLIIKKDEVPHGVQYMQSMIREVNDVHVEVNEILSYNLYEYDYENKQIKIVES